MDSREQLIKQHYTQRLLETNTKLQLADSRALHFHAEVGHMGEMVLTGRE